MYALTNENLPLIGASVDVPRYPRTRSIAGIVHFGVGGFHRAHHAAYIDQLLSESDGCQWAICGVGVLRSDRRMAEVMSAQDGLYTLVQKHPDGHMEARVIGSIVDYLFAPDDPEAVLEKLFDPATKIVSLTITEGGYNIDHVTGAFDLDARASRRIPGQSGGLRRPDRRRAVCHRVPLGSFLPARGRGAGHPRTADGLSGWPDIAGSDSGMSVGLAKMEARRWNPSWMRATLILDVRNPETWRARR